MRTITSVIAFVAGLIAPGFAQQTESPIASRRSPAHRERIRRNWV